jgi:hypothetical protein
MTTVISNIFGSAFYAGGNITLNIGNNARNTTRDGAWGDQHGKLARLFRLDAYLCAVRVCGAPLKSDIQISTSGYLLASDSGHRTVVLGQSVI